MPQTFVVLLSVVVSADIGLHRDILGSKVMLKYIVNTELRKSLESE